MVLVASGHLATDQQQVVAPTEHHKHAAFNCNNNNKHNKESSRVCCCCCSCFVGERLKVNAQSRSSCNNNNKIFGHKNQQQDCKLVSNKMNVNKNKNIKSSKLFTAINRNKPANQHDWKRQIDCNKLNCNGSNNNARSSKQLVVGCDVNDDEPSNCAKCQLIARWTSAQARLTSNAKRLAEPSQLLISKSTNQLNGSKFLRPMRTISEHWRSADCRRRAESSGDLRLVAVSARDCCQLVPKGRAHRQPTRARWAPNSDRCQLDEEVRSQVDLAQEWRTAGKRGCENNEHDVDSSKEDDDDEGDEEAEISSLTDSSALDTAERGGPSCDANEDELDGWSLTSCYEASRRRKLAVEGGAANPVQIKQSITTSKRLPSLRVNRRRAVSAVAFGVCRKLRPAPLPPGKAPECSAARQTRSKRHTNQHLPSQRDRCDNSLDSGNSSGPDTSSAQPDRQQLAPETSQQSMKQHKQLVDNHSGEQKRGSSATEVKPDLLSESEVFSIEHFLRSHKSSIYVCGCMANLYLTSTQLIDNGRCSQPSADGWQLSKTGVPVLTFDSGLTRNRNKRRLSINLAERGSGFVLWSDIIDHLSNYSAYKTSKTPTRQAQLNQEDESTGECDTFHVMYLSTNHRIMVGLSFDDAKCARLFLKQVELVTSDPANISLTGPKLARRLASVGRLSRLLTSSPGGSKNRLQARNRKRAKSINGQLDDGDASCRQIGDTSDTKQKPLRLKSLIKCRSDQTDAPEQSQSGALATPACAAGSSQRRFTTGADYTWSTLKRAIRFGQQYAGSDVQADGKRQLARLAAKSRPNDRIDEDLFEEDGEAGNSFKPKPLASLAMSGKVYRGAKKLPRKCDISAPCLFQHVTRVDLNGLERLYSRSLVLTSGRVDCVSCSDFQDSALDGTSQKQQAAVLKSGLKYSGAQASATGEQRHLSQISSERACQPLRHNASAMVNPRDSSINGTSTTISSSSCYSSASISPASSDCGVHIGQPLRPDRAAAQQAAGLALLRAQARPTPPKVPQRSSSSETASEAIIQCYQRRHEEVDELSGANKIQAIIRELQAQTSAELVDAKRKLTEQVLARAASSSLSSVSRL